MFPLDIQYRDFEESEALTSAIWEYAEKLNRLCDRITSCRVVVSAPHRHHHQGRIYQVQVHMHIPAADIHVAAGPEKPSAHEDVYVAVRDAFAAVQRRLEDHLRRQRGDVKQHEVSPHGRVTRVFQQEGYGFISTNDNREIYFHENAVLNNEFQRLEVGDEVRFAEELGEKGPKVTSMARVSG